MMILIKPVCEGEYDCQDAQQGDHSHVNSLQHMSADYNDSDDYLSQTKK